MADGWRLPVRCREHASTVSRHESVTVLITYGTYNSYSMSYSTKKKELKRKMLECSEVMFAQHACSPDMHIKRVYDKTRSDEPYRPGSLEEYNARRDHGGLPRMRINASSRKLCKKKAARARKLRELQRLLEIKIEKVRSTAVDANTLVHDNTRGQQNGAVRLRSKLKRIQGRRIMSRNASAAAGCRAPSLRSPVR